MAGLCVWLGLCAGIGIGLLQATAVEALPPGLAQTAGAKILEDQFRPLLVRHCIACHGGEKPKAKFRLDNLTTDLFVSMGSQSVRSRLMLSVVGCHAEGEVGDVIVGGFLPPAAATMFERMKTMERDFDHVRRFLLCEPRGSMCRHVNLLTPPIIAGCDVGVIIMEPTEYVPMSGSNLICTVTVILETGIVPIKEPETIVMVDTPAGPVKAVADCRDGRCLAVEFENVPSFVDRLDAAIDVAGLGTFSADIAYGGMFYAIVDATKLGFRVDASEARELAVAGEQIRLAAREQLDVVHPENPGIRGVSIVQLARPFEGVGNVTRNTCIVAPGRSDRSPTGTGTCAEWPFSMPAAR